MSAHLATLDRDLASIQASDQVLALLRDLHTQALTEPPYRSTDSQLAAAALDRFVALEPDKCALVYLLARSICARYIVEAGTSFGVSTIYLALAVGQNAPLVGDGQVIATENEPTKAARARQHWKQGGSEVDKWIDLREGDLRETLQADMPGEVDLLLLDIWAALALPALRLVQPHMRIGALVVADNTDANKEGYHDLIEYLEDHSNGFRCTTAPYSGGLYVAVYMGK